MSLAFTINDVDHTDFFLSGVCSGDYQLENVGQWTGVIHDPDNSFVPVVGQQLAIFDNSGTRCWGGIFESIKETRFDMSLPDIRFDFTAVNFTKRLYKRYIPKAAYFGKAPGFIVRDIFTNIITDEGIDGTTYVQLGAGQLTMTYTADHSTGTLTSSGGSWPTGIRNGLAVEVTGTHPPPDPLQMGDVYYLVHVTSTTCQLSDTINGDPITLNNNGSDTNTLHTILASIVYDYTLVSDALDELARFAGFVWYVDENAKLHFEPRTQHTAPFDITDDNAKDNIRNFSITRAYSKGPYRNRVIYRVASAAFASDGNTFVGDGTARSWDTDNPVSSVDSMKRNGVDVSYGILGTDTNKDFYYTPGSTTIKQDPAGTVMAAGNTQVTYDTTDWQNGNLTISGTTLNQGQPVELLETAGGTPPAPLTLETFYYIITVNATTVQLSATPGGSPITLTSIGSGGGHKFKVTADSLVIAYRAIGANVVIAEDSAEQTARAAIENGTGGIWEYLVDDSSNADAVGALDKATKDIATYGKIPDVIEYDTEHDGLRPGQLQNITLPIHHLDGHYLIQSITVAYLNEDVLEYHVTLISGANVPSWLDYFSDMANQSGGSTGGTQIAAAQATNTTNASSGDLEF